MSEPAPTTFLPASSTHFIVSRVERPVVSTSSTTSTGSSSAMVKPAAQSHEAVLPLGEERPYAKCAAHFFNRHPEFRPAPFLPPMLRPDAAVSPQVRTQLFGDSGMLQYLRALYVAIAVQPGGENERPSSRAELSRKIWSSSLSVMEYFLWKDSYHRGAETQRDKAETKCRFFASLRMTCHPERSEESAFLAAFISATIASAAATGSGAPVTGRPTTR